MRVFDTSAWIEKLLGGPLGLRLDKEPPDPDACIVPTIVQLELAKWLAREVELSRANRTLAYLQTCLVVPLNTELAYSAASLCREYKLATADAITYATAFAANAELVTCHAHFEALPKVRYFAKNKSASP